MDPRLYEAATQGNVDMLRKLFGEDPRILNFITPQENTALHIAARLGHKPFAEAVLDKCETLLVTRNVKGDTPMHIAAQAGHLEIVELLVTCTTKWPTDVENGETPPLQMKNGLRNTPLHEAVKNCYSEIALKLLEAEPSAAHMMNLKKETPLHIAAREGLKDVVAKILEQNWVPEREELEPPKPGTGSPLHQAVLGGHRDIVKLLLNKKSDLTKVVDEEGNTALHYAAQKNDEEMVAILLEKESSLAYVANKISQSPLHVAAVHNASAAIKEILKRCPDAAEQADDAGMNALHIAVVSRTVGALKCLLKNICLPEIINQADKDGNTPLHLAAKKSRIYSTLLLLKDTRTDPCILNNENQTAQKIIESFDEIDTYQKEQQMYVLQSLKKTELKRCKKQHQMPNVDTTQKSFKKKKTQADEHFKSCVEIYTLVAALITTVTFAATFTMPGGYDQKLGYPLLAKNPAFKAFVISNTIAMCSSLIVVFCFIWAWKDPMHFKFNQLIWGHRLIVVASLAMFVAVMTAVYAVLDTQCKWVAVIVCLICCSAPIMLWAILGNDILFIPQ